MKPPLSKARFALLAFALAACGGDGGTSRRPVIIPDVPAGANEAGCMSLCTLSASQTVCTATHAEYCLARCRAVTRDLPAACTDCLIAEGTPIQDDIRDAETMYCWARGVADLGDCAAECDDGGATPPSPDLETECQLICGFYTSDHVPLACSPEVMNDCLSDCRATIAAQGRVCAQCMIERIAPGRSCFNDECDCLLTMTFDNCTALCDATPPAL